MKLARHPKLREHRVGCHGESAPPLPPSSLDAVVIYTPRHENLSIAKLNLRLAAASVKMRPPV